MNICILCRSTKDDELLFGKIYTNEVRVHEKCLYLSSNLTQRGGSSNTILDFDIGDIKAEADRVSKLKCCYCLRSGANIGCCNLACRRTFHTGCGLKKHAQNQFMGKFKSYCHSHVLDYKERPDPSQKCFICFDLLLDREEFKCTSHIHGKCCNNGWYHKLCLQEYANSAGYFFKCPLCNDSQKFRSIVEYGISVPDCDASWESDEMYEDHFTLQTTCTANKCIAANGREGDELQLFYCRTCGSNPMHPDCTYFDADEYRCNTCAAVLGSGELRSDDDLNWFTEDDSGSDSEKNEEGGVKVSHRKSHSVLSEVVEVRIDQLDSDSDMSNEGVVKVIVGQLKPDCEMKEAGEVSDEEIDVKTYGSDDVKQNSDSDVDTFEKLFETEAFESCEKLEETQASESGANAEESMVPCDSDTDWEKIISQFERDKENKEANVLWNKQPTAVITSPRTTPISPLRVRYSESQEANKPKNEVEPDLVEKDEEPLSKKMKVGEMEEPSLNNKKEEDGNEEPSSNNEKEKVEEKPSSSNTKEKEEPKELASAQTNPNPVLVSRRLQSYSLNAEPPNCIATRTRSRFKSSNDKEHH